MPPPRPAQHPPASLPTASCSCFRRCGDEIVEINDAPVHCMTLNDVYAVLSHCDPGPVPIIVSRHPDPQVRPAGGVLFVRGSLLVLKQEQGVAVAASVS